MKKFFVYLVLFLSIVLFLLYIVGSQQESKETLVFEKNPSDSSSFVEIDTDKDGLKDWEESLWDTDPNNPDTDGDGTKDGEEINLGRNPHIPPPDNKLPDLLSKGGGIENKTDIIAKEIIVNYLNLKESGEFDSGKTQEELINSLVENISLEKSSFVPYTITDLNITDSESANTKNIYQDSVRGFIDKYVYPELGNELQILFDVLGTSVSVDKKQKAFISLEKAERTYKAISKDLLTLLVPASSASKHLVSVNVFASLSDAVNKMKTTINDPILAIPSVQYYLELSEILVGI